MLDLQVLELANVIEHRHSCRLPFDPRRRIPDQDLQRLLEAARWAPTVHNMQNFEIVVVDDQQIVNELGTVRALPSEAFLRENYAQLSFSEDELRRKRTGVLAEMFPPSWRTPSPRPEDAADAAHSFLGRALQSSPLLLMVIYDTRRRAPASEGDVLGIMSLGCVLQNIWLMATALGIGVQILSAFSAEEVESRVRRLLDIPGHMKIAFACRLGYPGTLLGSYLRVRREVQEFTHYNHYASRAPL